MTNNAFLVLLNELHKKEIAVLNEKEKQYSNNKSRFHNFERIASLDNCNRALVAWRLMRKQYMAFDDWLTEYSRKSDGIEVEEFKKYVEEYIIDMRNYLALIYAMLYENIVVEE